MRFLLIAVLAIGIAWGQTAPARIRQLLEPPLETPDVVAYQLRQYLMAKAPKLAAPATAAAWTTESQRLRRKILDDVVFHGWPREWVTSAPKFEDLGPIPAGEGYKMRKLRYEIVPGFWSSAILYEPANLAGKAPAILNVNGHVGAAGKAVEYKQKRCINQARQGFVSLNLEWLNMGELSTPNNQHWYGAHLDLAGANGVGLFYLAMRRGLDYLEGHPNVDRARLGVTGLSGGGWQTIILSALDERVQAAVPVAGYSALISRIERPADTGDIEQNPTDLLLYGDYTHLTAMRAPRPTLLIYNAEDDCCFRGPLVKPYIFDEVKPFFRLYGREDALAWHLNTDPSDHNYQLDNREASYAFLTRRLGRPVAEREIPVDAEVKSVEELSAGMPADNLTILGLARRIAARIERRAGDRGRLKEVVRYRETGVAHAWALANTRSKGLETRSYRFDFDNGLSATGVWLKAVAATDSAPATIVLSDDGRKAAAAEVSERVNRGERVLALDLVFTGDGAPKNPGPHAYAQMLSTLGERALGIEAGQLVAAARWLGAGKRRVEAIGPRSQVTALIAAALEPALFADVVVQKGMNSLGRLLDAPVDYQRAPDLFCLDLYKDFDLDRLRALGQQR